MLLSLLFFHALVFISFSAAPVTSFEKQLRIVAEAYQKHLRILEIFERKPLHDPAELLIAGNAYIQEFEKLVDIDSEKAGLVQVSELREISNPEPIMSILGVPLGFNWVKVKGGPVEKATGKTEVVSREADLKSRPSKFNNHHLPAAVPPSTSFSKGIDGDFEEKGLPKHSSSSTEPIPILSKEPFGTFGTPKTRTPNAFKDQIPIFSIASNPSSRSESESSYLHPLLDTEHFTFDDDDVLGNPRNSGLTLDSSKPLKRSKTSRFLPHLMR